jgi:hypothetical protein
LYHDAARQPLADWTHDLSLWNTVVEGARAIWGTQWSLIRVAHIASALEVDAGFLCERLLDNSAPLCGRAAHARLKSDDRDWWIDNLNSAEQDLELAFVTLMLLTWATADVICKLIDVIDEKVVGLSDQIWTMFAGTLGLSRWIADKRQAKSAIRIKSHALPSKMSPRLAACMLLMSNRVLENAVLKKSLLEYDGPDEQILGSVQRVSFSLANNGKLSWPAALKAIKTTYSSQTTFEPLSLSSYYYREKTEIPADTARQVCANVTKYPTALVGIAEAVIARQVRARLRRVSQVADKEHWFEI